MYTGRGQGSDIWGISRSWDQLCRPTSHMFNGYRWFRGGTASGASNNTFSCSAEVKNTWIFTATPPSAFESWNTGTASRYATCPISHAVSCSIQNASVLQEAVAGIWLQRRTASWNTSKVMQMHGAWRHYHTHPFLYRTAASIGTYGRGGALWQTDRLTATALVL